MGCGNACLTFILFCCLSILSGCSMEASLESMTSTLDEITKSQRTNADFIDGEIVTTNNGVVVKGTFGEIGERRILNNGVVIEGVFYE